MAKKKKLCQDCGKAISRQPMRKHNQREWERKQRAEQCPQNCAWRGKPHCHVYEARYANIHGGRKLDPEFPYKSVGRNPPTNLLNARK